MTAGKVLILEDDPSSAAFYAWLLRRESFEVVVCTTFEAARQQLKVDPPDALLTDVRVGEYNGLHLAVLFRDYSPDGRLVVVTGFDDVVIRRQVDELNGSFLLKPIEGKQLQEVFAVDHPSTEIHHIVPRSQAHVG
jgi:DNA-binding response OmpR family regulator